ncbi:MAG: PleD family two-component system response regulator [Candidatus Limnocylindria bacterium]
MGSLVFCEDDPMIRRLIEAALGNTRHHIRVAPDGKACLALIQQERPDVVFTDVSMPMMDGLQLADTIRAMPDLADVPIVVMTARVQREQMDEYVRHGASDVLAKPFTMAELRQRVEAFAGGTKE